MSAILQLRFRRPSLVALALLSLMCCETILLTPCLATSTSRTATIPNSTTDGGATTRMPASTRTQSASLSLDVAGNDTSAANSDGNDEVEVFAMHPVRHAAVAVVAKALQESKSAAEVVIAAAIIASVVVAPLAPFVTTSFCSAMMMTELVACSTLQVHGINDTHWVEPSTTNLATNISSRPSFLELPMQASFNLDEQHRAVNAYLGGISGNTLILLAITIAAFVMRTLLRKQGDRRQDRLKKILVKSEKKGLAWARRQTVPTVSLTMAQHLRLLRGPFAVCVTYAAPITFNGALMVLLQPQTLPASARGIAGVCLVAAVVPVVLLCFNLFSSADTSCLSLEDPEEPQGEKSKATIAALVQRSGQNVAGGTISTTRQDETVDEDGEKQVNKETVQNEEKKTAMKKKTLSWRRLKLHNTTRTLFFLEMYLPFVQSLRSLQAAPVRAYMAVDVLCCMLLSGLAALPAMLWEFKEGLASGECSRFIGVAVGCLLISGAHSAFYLWTRPQRMHLDTGLGVGVSLLRGMVAISCVGAVSSESPSAGVHYMAAGLLVLCLVAILSPVALLLYLFLGEGTCFNTSPQSAALEDGSEDDDWQSSISSTITDSDGDSSDNDSWLDDPTHDNQDVDEGKWRYGKRSRPNEARESFHADSYGRGVSEDYGSPLLPRGHRRSRSPPTSPRKSATLYIPQEEERRTKHRYNRSPFV